MEAPKHIKSMRELVDIFGDFYPQTTLELRHSEMFSPVGRLKMGSWSIPAYDPVSKYNRTEYVVVFTDFGVQYRGELDVETGIITIDSHITGDVKKIVTMEVVTCGYAPGVDPDRLEYFEERRLANLPIGVPSQSFNTQHNAWFRIHSFRELRDRPP